MTVKVIMMVPVLAILALWESANDILDRGHNASIMRRAIKYVAAPPTSIRLKMTN